MRRNRMLIVLLAIVTVLAMATAALAAPPPGKGKPPKPDPPPDTLWTCAARVDNGAVWLPGKWDDPSYVSDFDEAVPVDIPLCIDMVDLVAPVDYDHRNVVNWTVSWEGEPGRKDPKGLMFIFEEEVPGSHYAQHEVLPICEDDDKGVRTCDGSLEMTLIFDLDEDGVFGDEDGIFKHLVFLAMGRQGDKWKSLEFTVTPHQ